MGYTKPVDVLKVGNTKVSSTKLEKVCIKIIRSRIEFQLVAIGNLSTPPTHTYTQKKWNDNKL